MWFLPPLPKKPPKVFWGRGWRLLSTYMNLALGEPAQIVRTVLLEALSSECAPRIHACPNRHHDRTHTSQPNEHITDEENVGNVHECIGPSWTIHTTITRYIIDVPVDLQQKTNDQSQFSQCRCR